jgi:hypothetical protein
MKLPAILSIFFIGLAATNGWALPKYGVSSLTSPTKEYTLKLVDTSTPYQYQLKILRSGAELAHYPFEGELVSAYWSPSLKFVAVDNHLGMGGFQVWIVSLEDGSIITSHGVVTGANYDRYLDGGYFSNLLDEAHKKLKKINPGIDNDQTTGWIQIGGLWMDV